MGSNPFPCIFFLLNILKRQIYYPSMKQPNETMKKGDFTHTSDLKLSWTFLDGSIRTAVILDTVVIGKGEYRPGWRWSTHVGAMTGKKSEAHIGYILSGEMMIKGPDGKEMKVSSGDAFEIKPNHDAWVIGNNPCVALDFCYIHKKK
jgi:hypothetical protein